MPAAWPVGHVAATISKSADDKPQENKGGYDTSNFLGFWGFFVDFREIEEIKGKIFS